MENFVLIPFEYSNIILCYIIEYSFQLDLLLLIGIIWIKPIITYSKLGRIEKTSIYYLVKYFVLLWFGYNYLLYFH